MNASAPTLSAERALAERLAKEAAAVILEVKDRARANAQEKSDDQGPVTEADLKADALIRTGLTEAFPEDAVITEETWVPGTDIDAHARVWFVDPVDGTKDFVRGGPDYSVMIGLVIDGRPALGVVFQPETGLCWSASVPDSVCERIDAEGTRASRSLQSRAVPEGPVRVASSKSHKTKVGTLVAERMGAKVIEKGSVGLKVALVLDDEAELYVSGSRRIKVWDTAGPAALILAAGGEMRDIDDRPLTYVGPAAHGNGIRAYTPAAQAKVGGAIDALVAEFRAKAAAKGKA